VAAALGCPAEQSSAVYCESIKEKHTAFMANTKKLTKEERKKAKRTSRKKVKAEKPLKPREYARGSKKRKVKNTLRGAAKR
jgi:hypothetical protein